MNWAAARPHGSLTLFTAFSASKPRPFLARSFLLCLSSGGCIFPSSFGPSSRLSYNSVRGTCSMKYCPACNFSFPDFHHVCDFDGTELVSDPEHSSLVSAPPSKFRRILRSPMFLASAAILVLVVSAVLIGCLESGVESAPTVKYQTMAPPSRISSAPEQSFAQIKLPPPPKRSLASPRSLPRTSHATLPRPQAPGRSVARVHQRTSDRNVFESTLRVDRSSDASITRELADAGRSGTAARADAGSQPGTGVVVTAPAPKTEIATRKETPQASRLPVMQTERRNGSNDKSAKLTGFLKSTWKVLKKPF